jgi:hypothetical protein
MGLLSPYRSRLLRDRISSHADQANSSIASNAASEIASDRSTARSTAAEIMVTSRPLKKFLVTPERF